MCSSLRFLGLSKVRIKDGKRIRFVNMDIKSVVEVKTPRAMVPPKSEKAKIMNPAKRTMEV